MGKKRKSNKIYGKDAHNWRGEMKPLLLAAACVTMAVEHSKEAKAIYQQIIDAWDRPDCQALLKDDIALPYLLQKSGNGKRMSLVTENMNLVSMSGRLGSGRRIQ